MPEIERNIAAKRIYTAPVILNKEDIKGSFIKHIDDKKMVFNQSSFNIIIFLAAVFTIYMYVVHMAFAPNIRANKEIKEIKVEVEERERTGIIVPGQLDIRTYEKMGEKAYRKYLIDKYTEDFIPQLFSFFIFLIGSFVFITSSPEKIYF